MEDLVESILDYVRADYTDYAIMINRIYAIKWKAIYDDIYVFIWNF